MNAIVDVSVVLQSIRDHDWSGVAEAATHCHVATETLNKLLAGKVPRLDALFRICNGLGLELREVIPNRAGTYQKENRPGRRVLPGRWALGQVAENKS